MIRNLVFGLSLFVLASCGSEKKEEQTDIAQPATTEAAATTENVSESPKATISLTALPTKPSTLGAAVFTQNDKIVFYYNVDEKKGQIAIADKTYALNKYAHEINGSTYDISGPEVSIKIAGCKYHDVEEPNPGHLYGNIEMAEITMGQMSEKFTDITVVDGTNAD